MPAHQWGEAMFEKYRLKFKADEEQRYVETVGENNRMYWRIALAIFAVLFGLFSALDVVLIESEYLILFLVLRFLVVIPTFIITIGLTFTRFFKRFYEWFLLANFIIGGFVIVTMLILSPDSITYYGGLFLVLFSGILLLRIRLIYAIIGAFSILTYLMLGWVFVSGFEATQIASLLFYIAAVFIGLFGLYYLEHFSRETYHYEMELTKDRDSLASRVSAQLEDLHRAQSSTIIALSKLVESRDHVTGEHIENVSILIKKITRALPLPLFHKEPLDKNTFVDVIANACALHDIGKVGIPDFVLNKPGPLNEDERRLMQRHVIIGYETLLKVREKYPDNAFINMGCDIALYHHERIDGKGYPYGLKSNDIPLSARIMALVDVYDALVSKRPYKDPWPHEKAVETIVSGRGTQFDKDVVDAFLKVVKTS